MDSANGFCLPRKCPLLIIKKQKNVFFLLFFITSSLLSNSRRKKGTAQIQPGPAREREVVRDQTVSTLEVMIKNSGFIFNTEEVADWF